LSAPRTPEYQRPNGSSSCSAEAGVRSRAAPDARLRALVGAARATVLTALWERQTTTSMAARLGVAASTVSEQLTTLAHTGLVDRGREGREVYYMLNDRGREFLSLFDS
jgi:DNA-binding transcriptional ArsR family regulator